MFIGMKQNGRIEGLYQRNSGEEETGSIGYFIDWTF